ncbi:hypothetical protein BD626DRAFT_545633 [Schizophyllum amplum]|uniref:Transcription elongation factor Eaf N-terminal domain-containing protein n=1 Tax=Schizophyllum amplum TaxID=97359 RepID=A0A550CUX9_9AGAR|nr:hypothetical protein BD626DRAFT_545633 [Auriculariopsis ampla]
MAQETPWLPAHGKHSVSIGSSLSKALQARKNQSGPPNPSKFDKHFYGVRYNHKPSSIDTSRLGSIERNPENKEFPVTLQQPSKDNKQLEWQEWTCTQSYVLEKVESSINMTFVRRRLSNEPVIPPLQPSGTDDLASELEDALRAQESSEEGEIPLTETAAPKPRPKPKPLPRTKPQPAAPPSPKGKNKRESPPPAVDEAPPPAVRPIKRSRPSPPPQQRKSAPLKKFAPPRKETPPPKEELMFPTAGGGITLPGASGFAQPAPAPSPPPARAPTPPPRAPSPPPAAEPVASDSEEEDWDEVPAAPTPAFDGLELEEIDGDDLLERELTSQLGGGGDESMAAGEPDDEGDDDMFDVFEQEMNMQLGEGNAEVEQEDEDDFLAGAMDPPPPSDVGAPMSLNKLAGGGDDYDDYSSSSEEDDD